MWVRLLRGGPDDLGHADVALRLTAIILLLRPFDVWWITPFVLLGAGLSLLFRSVRQSPLTWLLLSGLVAARIAVVWPLADNHIYLLAYWCLAIGLALSGPGSAATLAASSRWLLGAAFLMAVLWKGVLSPDYLDGRFFRVTLMSDDRFGDAVMLVSGMTADQITQNRAFLSPLPEGTALADPPRFVETLRQRAFVALATWGGLGLEGLLAFLYLVPGRRLPDLSRHVALTAFCAITYALAPVAGFGWLLAAMGLAQCRADQWRLRAVYVSVFFLVLLYSEIPWAAVLAGTG